MFIIECFVICIIEVVVIVLMVNVGNVKCDNVFLKVKVLFFMLDNKILMRIKFDMGLML